MPQDGTNLPVGDLSGIGGFMPQGFGYPGQMMGVGGLGFQDPAWTGAMAKQRYAQALMQQGSQISPVISPWQALARGVQGALGGYEMNQSIGQMQRQNQQWQQDLGPSMQGVQDVLSGLRPGQGAPQQPQTPALRQAGPGMEQPASAQAIAALPDVQALPVSVQPMLVQKMAASGLGLNAAAQYARMLKVESGGSNIDSKTGGVITSPAGARGLAQVMPGTFTAMQKRYGLTGDINDPSSNLDAGLAYYKEGLGRTNGDLAGAAVYYNGGDRGLDTYIRGGQLLPETAAYLTSTGAPNAAAMPTGAGGGVEGYAPGTGLQAANQLRMIAMRLSMQPMNPYAQAMSRNIMAMIPQIAGFGALTAPRPVAGTTGLSEQYDIATGKRVLSGEQPSGVTQELNDYNTLQTLGQTPWASMTPDQQTQYGSAYARVGKPEYTFNDRTGWTLIPSTRLPPNITRPPGAAPGATPGAAPGAATAAPGATTAAPAVSPPTTVPGTFTPQIGDQIKADQALADEERADALEVPNTRMLTDQIRALIQRVPTGALGPLQLELSKVMAGVAGDTKAAQAAGMNTADAELLEKLFLQFSSQGAKSLGSREPGSVVQMYADAYPSIKSRGATINEFTRATDMQGLFTQQRAELMQQWLAMHRSDPGYQSINSPAFNTWARQQGLDPRIYASAALMASGQPHSIYATGLSRGAAGNAEIEAARNLAWRTYPGLRIMGPDGNPYVVGPDGQPQRAQ